MPHIHHPHKDLTKDLKKCVLEHDPTVDARLTRVLTELKTGFSFLETFKCDRVVTFFGSARAKPNTKYYSMAREFAHMLADHDFTVITGGGPGIMEAANRGAFDGEGRSAGINIFLPSGERKNRFTKESLGFYYFFNRKVILAYTAEAFVFFPGGFGTLDELFEISTLIATRKIESKIPVILIGTQFWKPLEQWLKKTVIRGNEFLTEKELKTWIITDDLKKAFKIISESKSIQPRIMP